MYQLHDVMYRCPCKPFHDRVSAAVNGPQSEVSLVLLDALAVLLVLPLAFQIDLRKGTTSIAS